MFDLDKPILKYSVEERANLFDLDDGARSRSTRSTSPPGGNPLNLFNLLQIAEKTAPNSKSAAQRRRF
jgi:hypothetical protein